jgi:hypothetical protein
VTTSTSRISQINLVTIPSPDQDRSIDFYVNKLGFEKRTDVPFGGSYRWVEVYPPLKPRISSAASVGTSSWGQWPIPSSSTQSALASHWCR